jgi:hypothetical protein
LRLISICLCFVVETVAVAIFDFLRRTTAASSGLL